MARGSARVEAVVRARSGRAAANASAAGHDAARPHSGRVELAALAVLYGLYEADGEEEEDEDGEEEAAASPGSGPAPG